MEGYWIADVGSEARALMLMNAARIRARTVPCGELVPLELQNRTLAGHHRLAAGKTASLPEKAYLEQGARHWETGDGEGQIGHPAVFQDRRFP